MERVGFAASAEKLSEIGTELDARIVELTERIYEQAGGEFNINSTKQLSKVLFEDLGLPPAKKTKTGCFSGTHHSSSINLPFFALSFKRFICSFSIC